MSINDEKELLNVYDEKGNVLYTASRKQVHQQGLHHRVVHLWFCDGEFLYFQQRSADKEAFPLGYDITCAGHIDSDESAIEACKRECYEELGLTVTEKELKKIGTYYEEIEISCGMDCEIADVFLCNQVPDGWNPNDEVITIGKIKLAEIRHCLNNYSSVCNFFDLLNNREILLTHDQIFLHESAYYQWLLKAIF